MAGVALQVRVDVLRTSALRLYVVVTRGTTATGLRVVEVDRGLPRDGRMAAIASIGGEDVIRGLGGCAYRGADTMAGRAFARCPLEYRIGVTRLARQIAVLPQEFEACRQVVEGVSGLRPVARWEHEQRQQNRGQATQSPPAPHTQASRWDRFARGRVFGGLHGISAGERP